MAARCPRGRRGEGGGVSISGGGAAAPARAAGGVSISGGGAAARLRDRSRLRDLAGRGAACVG
eukprot:scaffold138747_cov136-Phaeocystis_antarctica.AAC.2